jgi:hypothetical protein
VFLLSTNAKVKKNDRRQCQSLCLKISDLFALYLFTCCILQQHSDLFSRKTVACKQVQNFIPPRSFDFQDFYQSRKTGKIFSKKCISGTKSKINKSPSNLFID